MAVKYFVLADVHSFYDEMMKVLDEKGFEIDNLEHHVVLCGDAFDRGPKPKEVFDFLRKLDGEARLTYIIGNHELLLIGAIDSVCKMRGLQECDETNGTLDTITAFTGLYKNDLNYHNFMARELYPIYDVIDFVKEKGVYYKEIGDKLLVHGWVPVNEDGPYYETAKKADWESAVWSNGMEYWKDTRNRVAGKTVICGHFHASYGNARIHKDSEEFPLSHSEACKVSFRPFVDDGIIAMDSNVVYSGFCNCIVLDESGVEVS